MNRQTASSSQLILETVFCTSCHREGAASKHHSKKEGTYSDSDYVTYALQSKDLLAKYS